MTIYFRLFRLSVLLTGVCAAAGVLGQTSPPQPSQFAIRNDGRYVDPDSIWRYDGRSTAIPINKRYEELTKEQKEILRSSYKALAEEDEPPFPKNGLEALVRGLIKAQQHFPAVGPLRLLARIDSAGKAHDVRVLANPSQEMVKFASWLLLSSEFKPAICAGEPCEMDYLLSVSFKR